MKQRWRQPLDDTERRPLFNGVKQNVMNHPGYTARTPRTTPPSLRVGMRIASSPIARSQPSTSEIRRAFLRILRHTAVTDLVTRLTAERCLVWTPWDGSGRDNHGAVLGRGEQDATAPTAWARLLLPDPSRSSFWRDAHSADFVLHIEPRMRNGEPELPLGLREWHRLFVQILSLPTVIATLLLSTELGLDTPQEPGTKVGVWLAGQSDLGDLIQVVDFQRLPGTHISSWFDGYAVVDEACGDNVSVVATEWIRQMCDDALHLDGYEPQLLILSDG